MDQRSMERVVEQTHLGYGSHANFEAGACAMELVSYIAGEPWSDHPPCVCPVLSAFVRRWNDDLPNDERDKILKPFLPRLIDTRGSNALAERRALMAADWLLRVHTPAWLQLAGLRAQADTLASLPEITSVTQLDESLCGPLEAIRKDAAAARAAAAWATAARAAAARAAAAGATAAGAAAAGAAAAWAAAAWAAAARAAAAGAAAAWATEAWAAAAGAAAAEVALKQTRLRLQGSACDLLSRMIDAKEAA